MSDSARREQWATLRVPIVVGVVARGQVRREIERAAYMYGLECEVAESKGWLESLYRFTIRGPVDQVRAFQVAIEAWSAATA